MKSILRVWAITMTMVLCLGLAGCGGGGADIKTQNTTTTLGQELQDLEAAYKKGIINEKQYEESKKNLIKQRTRD